jgi:hypothetical protein
MARGAYGRDMQKEEHTPEPASARGPSWAPTPADSLDELRSDCARMAPDWAWSAPHTPAHVPAARIHGLGRIMVPPASAALLNGMSEYGD